MSISYADTSIATLRTLVAVIDRELAASPPAGDLRVAWAQVVELLSLGHAPELRECPHCKEIGMRAATRCIRCWSSLPVLAPAELPAAA